MRQNEMPLWVYLVFALVAGGMLAWGGWRVFAWTIRKAAG